jgi:hypothetical protein
MIGLSIAFEKATPTHSPNPTPTLTPHGSTQSTSLAPDGSALSVRSGGFYSSSSGYGAAHTTIAGNSRSRNHTAVQVIRRGSGGGDPAAALPLGYALSVRLMNAILSTDSASPVIAEVVEDVYSHGVLSIPAKTRAIGSVRFDDSSRRLQLKFSTLVYPEGDQHPVQAIGMMPDGSAGLDGDYHSGEGSRKVGHFLSHFIGAMADGMKDRQASGAFGIPYEPGSLKNGILSGISLSAEDEAKSITENLSSAKPTMTLPSGQSFLLFLEREYIP